LERSSNESFTDAVSSKTKVVHPTIEPSVQKATHRKHLPSDIAKDDEGTRPKTHPSWIPKIANFFKIGHLSHRKKKPNPKQKTDQGRS
jgi:hypothetical protein